MSRNSRIAWFGLVAALVVVGVICALVIGGGTSQILAFVLIGGGLVLATSLVFLEVGLSEDRDRTGTHNRKNNHDHTNDPDPENDPDRTNNPEPKRTPQRRLIARPPLERSRGHRHRLR
ncbi:MAG: hypothetical protein ACTHQQ_18830 [Solirubrobacteraceae bacterium]